MGSVYSRHLPSAFPYSFRMPYVLARQCIDLLMGSERTDVPNGSSFAFTADAPGGWSNLYLSQCSLDYLKEMDLLE